jgi:lipoprotein-anchoring transpeptidase ErfK/SrfK
VKRSSQVSVCLVAVAAFLLPARAAGQMIEVDPLPAAEPQTLTAPNSKSGAWVARIVGPTTALAQPGAGKRVARVGVLTEWARHEQSLLVAKSATREGEMWLRVLLPIRPNGTFGWIPADATVLSKTPYWVRIRKRSRSVRIYRAGRLVRAFRAVIGKPSTPTPSGLAAIYEVVRQPNPRRFLGNWVLSLTALSDVLQEFGGASGRIGIHGRAGASLQDRLGSARSHGCVRIDNSAANWMARRLPPGTPVLVSG